MTRQDEMIMEYESAWNRKADDATKSLMLSVLQWADEHPDKDTISTAYMAGKLQTIDKACDWLVANFKEIGVQWQRGGGVGYLVEQFKKAMQ